MSTNLPPSGPPSQPPVGPPPSGPPEVLEQGSGGPMPPAPSRQRSGGGGRKWLIGGAVVGALAVGAAAFGAYTWLTSTGPQPAEALPADTLGYVSIDLDPSGSQKIAALKTLQKFPAADKWLDDEGIGSGDDIREFIFTKIQEEEGACDGLDFEDDIQPWLGDRFAIAAIDQGDGELPAPVGVVQVKDADGAQDDAEQLVEGCGGDPDDGGLAITGDWLIVAENDEIAQQVADDAADSSLADDAAFQKLTEAAGDPGVVSAYLSADSGELLADELGGLGGLLLGPGEITDCASGDLDGCLAPEGFSGEEELPDGFLTMLEDFGGLAMTVRFDDGSLEIESAGEFDSGLSQVVASDNGGDVIATLPEDTAMAFGAGFEPGWFEPTLEYFSLMAGDEFDFDGIVAEAEEMFDLSLPEDAETLAGESAAIAVGSDFDPEAFFGSDGGSLDIPIGAKIKGDPDAIQEVLDRVKATAPTPEDAEIFSSDSDGDVIVIGPDTDYLGELLGDGGLGDTDTYQDVVREDDLASVFFINFDAGDNWLAELVGDDAEIRDNLEPLAGLGVTGWYDDGVGHTVFRITSD